MAGFCVQRKVEFPDVDMAGVVYFANYFRYFEAAEHALFRSLGLPVFDPADKSGLCWPRVSAAFDYRAPLHYEDEFEVQVFVESVGHASVAYRGDIVRGGKLVATGRSSVVCCRLGPGGTLKATAIPPDVRAKLTAAMQGSHNPPP